MWHPPKKLDPFLPVFRHFFMSYFDVFGPIFKKSVMTDLPNVIVSMCLVSYNFCMIPHVCSLLAFDIWVKPVWGLGCIVSCAVGFYINKWDSRNCSHFPLYAPYSTRRSDIKLFYISIFRTVFLFVLKSISF